MSTREKFIDWMNKECVDDGVLEDILAGETMQDPENIAHAEKMSNAYGLAHELMTGDEELYWSDDTQKWSIGPKEE